MNEWKKWLSADYAFSNNGEKIKVVTKIIYTILLTLVFIAAAICLFGFLIGAMNGYIDITEMWLVPVVIAVVVLVSPFLIYWSLSTLYGFGELVANSYGEGTAFEEKAIPKEVPQKKKCVVNLSNAMKLTNGKIYFGSIFLVSCVLGFFALLSLRRYEVRTEWFIVRMIAFIIIVTLISYHLYGKMQKHKKVYVVVIGVLAVLQPMVFNLSAIVLYSVFFYTLGGHLLIDIILSLITATIFCFVSEIWKRKDVKVIDAE